jgi:hypothetical protein
VLRAYELMHLSICKENNCSHDADGIGRHGTKLSCPRGQGFCVRIPLLGTPCMMLPDVSASVTSRQRTKTIHRASFERKRPVGTLHESVQLLSVVCS